jgi:hypothetical protein
MRFKARVAVEFCQKTKRVEGCRRSLLLGLVGPGPNPSSSNTVNREL